MIKWEDLQSLFLKVLSEDRYAEITPNTNIIEDLDFDSVDIMRLFEEIEEQLGIDYTDLDDFVSRFQECGELFDGINELLEKKGDND